MSRSSREVVITGVGPITAIGSGVERFWEAIVEGRTGTRNVEFEWVHGRSFKSRIGAPVPAPEPAAMGLSAREAQLVDPASGFALAAAAMALEDAGLAASPIEEKDRRLHVDGVEAARAGVILGTGIGGLCTIERSHRAWVKGESMTGSLRYSIPMLISNALPAQVAIRYGFRGECKAVVTACASGTMALGDAFRLIRDGVLDLAIAGGVEKTISDVDGWGLLGFDVLKTLSTRNDEPEKASRPFDADRDGFVLGEGAGLLVLEAEEHARGRGARIYARISGYAANCDAHSMMQMEPSGDQLVRVMEQAMASGEVSPGEIGYANAHGTSTRLNDAQESRALRRVFGARVFDVLVNSTKAMLGHAIGAAGGIEAIVTVLALHRGLVHRCVNLDNPDPECDLALPRQNQAVRPGAALSNSFAFGGHNATLVLRSA